jgi:hypothetical protein
MAKEVAWNAPHDLVIYMDNVKVGDENSAFSDVSPDGSSPSHGATVVPPPEAVLLDVN